MNKYYFCKKNIAFVDCHKDATKFERRNLKRLLLSTRAYEEQKFCNGINFKLSYPRKIQQHCEKAYVGAKEACESNYVATYLKNKSDESLCRCVLKSCGSFRAIRLPLTRTVSKFFLSNDLNQSQPTQRVDRFRTNQNARSKTCGRRRKRGKNTGEC